LEPWGYFEYTGPNEERDTRAESSLIETLPVGTRVAANSVLGKCVMGDAWCTFWRIAAVWRDLGIAGVPAQWYWADMSVNVDGYGFVDTGLPFNTPATSTIRTSLA
jgi:hypothetical protein